MKKIQEKNELNALTLFEFPCYRFVPHRLTHTHTRARKKYIQQYNLFLIASAFIKFFFAYSIDSEKIALNDINNSQNVFRVANETVRTRSHSKRFACQCLSPFVLNAHCRFPTMTESSIHLVHIWSLSPIAVHPLSE